MKEKVRYYESFTDDFETAGSEDYKIPEDYEYIRRDFFSKLRSKVIYALAVVFGGLYIKLFLHVSYKNRKVLRKAKNKGFFLYGNHTQPVGDVFIPALAAFPKRIYTVVSPSNFSLPFIGKILPFLGALPLSDTPSKMKKFTLALEERLSENKVITIYPEAHVWEYAKDLRPFSSISFRYPVKFSAPVFSMTVTYQKRRFSKKPKAVVYIDGPFYPDSEKSNREQAKELHQKVYETMLVRSKKSTESYIEYIKKESTE